MKRKLSFILAAVLMLSVLTFGANAATSGGTDFKSAKALAINKSAEISFDKNKENFFKINAPGNGKIAVTITQSGMNTGIRVYNSEGNEVKPTDNDVDSGYWNSAYFWLKTNPATDKGKATITYNVKKGTSFIKFIDENKLNGDCTVKITFTAGNSGAVDAVFTVTLKEGETVQLGTALTPSNSKSKTTWKTDDKSIAAVTDKGKVTAAGEGTAEITATVNGMKFYINIIVEKK